MTGFITLFIVLLTGGFVVYGFSNEGSRPSTGQRDLGGRPLLGPTNETVLIYDDGETGAFFFDPKQRALVHEELDGQQPSGAPYRLSVVAGEIYVGWDPVMALTLSGGGSSRVVEGALYHLPINGGNSVWLVDYPSRQPGSGPATLRQVDSDGKVVHRISSLMMDGVAIVGLEDGVVFQGPSGVVVTDDSGREIDRFGSATSMVGDAQGDRIVWCDDPCTSLNITTIGGDTRVVGLPAGPTSFDARSLRFAPDGAYIGVALATAGGDGVTRTDVGLIDLDSAQVQILTRPTVMVGTRLGWSSDGGELFFAGPHIPSGGTLIGRWSKEDGDIETSEIEVQLPVTSFVVSTADAAQARVAKAITSVDKCGATIEGDCVVLL